MRRELFLAAVERRRRRARAVQRLAAAVWRGALGRGIAQPAALALVAQLLIGCWLAPALAAPHAYGSCIDSTREAFPPSVARNLAAVALELTRLPSVMGSDAPREGAEEALAAAVGQWVEVVLLLAADLDDGKGGGDAEEAAPAATARAPLLELVLLPADVWVLHGSSAAEEQAGAGGLGASALPSAWIELPAAVADAPRRRGAPGRRCSATWRSAR